MIEPRHNLRRPRSWGDLFFAMNGWLALIAGAALIVVTWMSVASYRDAQRLDVGGAWVVGEITDKRISRGDESDSYYATFAFEVAKNRYSAERNVGRSYYGRHSVNTAIDIKYWEQDPRTFEYIEGQTQKSARWKQVIALAIGFAGLLALWVFGGRTNSAVLARRRGVRTTARIHTFVERKNSGRPTGRGYMIFSTPDGQRGESLDHKIGYLRRLGAGTDIVVYVRGKDVWWEGDVGPRANVPSELPKVV